MSNPGHADFVAWAKAKNATYSRRRSVYRGKHPDRGHDEATAVYLAPPEHRIRPKVAADDAG